MIYNQIERHSKMANKNENLSAAKNATKDELYTQLVDIENELRACVHRRFKSVAA